jgi:hypothetical protein
MARGRFSRAFLTALLAASAAACSGDSSDGPPQDPWESLGAACTRFAEVGCAKDAECLPPIDSGCVAALYADCVNDGQEGGPNCVAKSASAIDDCATDLAAMTCTDYCTTSSAGTFCYAPCIWLCS